MNIEEARKVLWLKNNHRSMGKLLDDGFLNRSRLEWAAERAYDPTIKQAAKILLESQKKPSLNDKKVEPTQLSSPVEPLQINLTLEKARATLWPFAPYKGQPMGNLLDSNQLSLKDLGYAAETAWDEKVRQAAVALSLVRMEQAVKEPAPSVGFVRVISGGRSYSERKQIQLTYLQGTFIGCGFGMALMYFINALISHTKNDPPGATLTKIASTPTGIFAIAVAIGLIILALWLSNYIPDKITKAFEKKIEEYRRGEEGEEKTVQVIVQALDGNWKLFRNVVLPGRNRADIDLILVGPPGIWALEVKNFRGEYRNVGENWEYRHGNKWKSASNNPSQQALNNAVRLGNFLKADRLNVFVNPAIVWANEERDLQVNNPTVAVWPFNRLPDELGNIWQGEKVSKADREKIHDKLAQLCTFPEN